MTGWPLFALLVALGLVDLALGLVMTRTPDAAPGEKPAQGARYSPRERRIIGLATIGSAFLFWAMAGAFATGLFGAEFALPMFAGAGS